MKNKTFFVFVSLGASIFLGACSKTTSSYNQQTSSDEIVSSSSSNSSSVSSAVSSSSSSVADSSSSVASSSASSATYSGTYYSSINWSQSGATLKTALSKLIFSHTDIGYGGLYDAYKTTDVKPNGKIWDMYSAIEYTPGADENHSSYQNEGDNYNREHTIPQSVFKSVSPMYSDLFHIYPTDSKVNGIRGNFPHGEIAGNPSYTSTNGCKLGTSDTSTGYNGTVFEVIDEYKGDFARTYFYFVTAYESKMTGFSFPSLASNTYPSLSNWAKNLYLKWAKEDPVSEKEINRNERVYALQKNRNPFIDYPETAEKIWGPTA